MISGGIGSSLSASPSLKAVLNSLLAWGTVDLDTPVSYREGDGACRVEPKDMALTSGGLEFDSLLAVGILEALLTVRSAPSVFASVQAGQASLSLLINIYLHEFFKQHSFVIPSFVPHRALTIKTRFFLYRECAFTCNVPVQLRIPTSQMKELRLREMN